MATRRLSGIAVSASEPDNGGDHSGGGSGGVYVDDVFSTYLYKGNGSTQTITNGIDLAGEGGMIWTKQRSPNARSHFIGDSERDDFRNYLYPDVSNANSGLSSAGFDISSVSSTGYSLGADNYTFNNESGSEQVSWTFRKQSGFFDVVTYTGNGTAGREISHNLGCEPGMVIVKSTSSTGNWVVQHTGITPLASLYLNENYASWTTDNTGYWNNTAATSSSFTLGTSGQVNGSGVEYVAYLFAHDDSDESMIKCGSYTGTGSAGNSINLGFEPQWLMIKQTSGANDWYMYDTMRGIATGGNDAVGLKANSSDAEGSSNHLSVTSTGFELEGSGGGYNGSGATYIYVAIRRPNKPAEEFEPEELFAVNSRGADNPPPSYRSNFVVDTQIRHPDLSGGGDTVVFDRMRGSINALKTSATSAEYSAGSTVTEQDQMEGIGSNDAVDANDHSWMWRRAPGFFDVVAYTGNGSNRTINHNLGVAPELMIVKSRSNGFAWQVYSSALGATKRLQLNSTSAELAHNDCWNITDPTDYVFSLGTQGDVNLNNGTFVAYLFASVPGISKVGSYTGNGSEVTVDCGFTNGARWLLVKRTDANGDWYFTCNPNNFQILSKLNTTDAQVNYMSTYNDVPSGFRVTSTGGDLCVDGAEYIFYAIA